MWIRSYNWIKENWLLIVFALVLVVYGYMQHASANLYDKLMKDYNAQAETHNKEIDSLTTLYEKQKSKIDELQKTYDIRIQDIESYYDAELKKLKRQSKIKRNILLEESRNNPKILTKAVKDTFGIPEYTQ